MYYGNAPCVGGALAADRVDTIAFGSAVEPMLDLTTLGGGCAQHVGSAAGGGHAVDQVYEGIAIGSDGLALTLTGGTLNAIVAAIELTMTSP
jgi:hypothetical protein